MTNNKRKKIKERVKNIIESETNNKIIKINIITEKEVEVVCENQYSNSHIIDVLLNNKTTHLIYDGCLFLTKIS